MHKDFQSGRWRIFETVEEPWPDDEYLHPADELASGLTAIGEALASAISPLMNLFNSQVQSLSNIETSRQTGKVLVGTALYRVFVDWGLGDHVMTVPELQGLHDTAETIVEALGHHWAACKHKPRCKRPPEYVKFTDQKSKGKRGRGSWNSTVNLHR